MEHEFSIFWVPRRTLVSNSILEDAGIIGDVNVADFPLYFMPLEQDVLSLELETSFSDLYLVSMQVVNMKICRLLIPAAQRSRLHFPCCKSSHEYPTETRVLSPSHWKGRQCKAISRPSFANEKGT